MRSVWIASLTYFGIVFLAGFILGSVRVLLLVPLLGERNAELLELPVMTIISYLAAVFVIQKFSISECLSGLAVGLVGLILMLVLEFTVVLSLQGLSVGEYLNSRDTLSGHAYALSLALYAIFPAFITFKGPRDGV